MSNPKTATRKKAATGRSTPRSGARKSSSTELVRRAATIFRRLTKGYPNADCALTHRNPFELLIATILSAQCTDTRVNMVTPTLFGKYPDAAAMAAARQVDIESLIRSTGFYRNKAKSLKASSLQIVQQHHGRVPDTMAALTGLRGVARKTANVVLGNAYGKNEGVVVDTHVGRLSRRLGLSRQQDPKKVEQDLMALIPSKHWTLLAHLLIHHGRAVCGARKPLCDGCTLADCCPKVGVAVAKTTGRRRRVG